MSLYQGLQNLCAQSVISVQEEFGTEEATDTGIRLITEVAARSPAIAAGIAAGDKLVSVNDVRAIDFSYWRDWSSHETLKYRFYKPSDRVTRTIEMSPLPLGIATGKTRSTILDEYKNGNGRHENLIDLWERKDWEALKLIGDQWKKPNIFGLFLETTFKDRQSHSWQVEYLFKGIAEYEIGDPSLGEEIIEDFAAKYANDLQTAYAAIVLHNRAKRYWEANYQTEALETLQQAYQFKSLLPIRQQFVQFGAMVPNLDSAYIGTKFPEIYDFSALAVGNQRRNLSEILSELPEGAMHLICILHESRANQPYDRFMQRFVCFNSHFPHIFHSLDVLAGDTADVGWCESESVALKLKLPVQVLLDRENRIAEALQIELIPAIFGINRNGDIVLADQLYTEIELWNWLNAYTESKNIQ